MRHFICQNKTHCLPYYLNKYININMAKERKEAVWIQSSVHRKLKIISAINEENIGETAVKAINEYIDKNKEIIDSFFKD